MSLELDNGKPQVVPAEPKQLVPERASGTPASLTLSHFSLVLDSNTFASMEKTRQLHLHNNQITRILDDTNSQASLLPLGNIPDLTHITFNGNLVVRTGRSTAIPSQNFKMRQRNVLPSINIGKEVNSKIYLVPAISNLSNLSFLDLQHNHLTEVLAEPILSALPSLVSLHTLILSHNEFAEIPAALFQVISLTRLEISNNRIERIPAEIGNLRTLEVCTTAFSLSPFSPSSKSFCGT